jgi:O-antigen/teichoic acid export membrane protein
LPRFLERGARRLVEAGLAGGRTVAQVTQAFYGDYGVVNRFSSVLNNTVVTATIQTVSKYVAEDEANAPAVRALALRLQAMVGLALAGTYALAGGLVARLHNDPSLAPHFRIAAVILFAYSVYAVFIGYLNGTKRFNRQAGFDVTFSTIKVTSMLAVAFLGWGVDALFGAFGMAAIVICALAATIVGVRRGDAHRDLDLGALGRAWGLIAAYTLVTNLLLLIDVSVLKAAAAGAALGLPAEVVQNLSKSLVGIYNGVRTGADIPYQAVIAVAFVVFPLVSRSTFQEDRAATQAYIRNTLRYATVLLGLVGLVFAASPAELLRVLKPEFDVGGPALTVSVAGEIFLALFAIANTILIAAGRMGVALGIACVTAAVDLASNLLVVPRFIRLATITAGAAGAAGAAGSAASAATASLDPVALVATSAATAPALALGAALGLVYLQRQFGASVPLKTALRVLAVAGVLVAASVLGPRFGLVLTLVKSVVLMGAYGVGLYVLGELGPDDRARLMRVLRRKGS